MANTNKRRSSAKNGAAAEPHYFSDRLKRKLDQMRMFPATIVEAPSGYGKTTAVREYLDAAIPQSAGVYWLTAVGEASGACYRRFCREIERIDGRAGERLLKIDFPNAFTIGEICEVLRSIECRREAWLVLDNFQFLYSGLPPDFLAALLEHGAPKLHIVIVSQMLNREAHAAIAGRRFLHITSADLRLDGEDIRRYYALAGVAITKETMQEILHNTDGWIIAVYLQLCAFRETGSFSDAAVSPLLEKLVWDKLTSEQQAFFLRLSPFETATARQMCGLLGCDTLPGYALDALSSPFIRHDAAGGRYEPHSILFKLVAKKRLERGEAFERDCLLRAGDLCRSEGRIAEALAFYLRTSAYEQILALDFSHLLFDAIGGTPFSTIALEIAEHCPIEIRQRHTLSMVRVAWALKAAGLDAAFGRLLEELDRQLEESGPLRAEWLLLSAYRHFPHVDKMLPVVHKAAPLFGETCSGVILPDAPWCFGGYSQASELHALAGQADREADQLEEFVALYSRLTNGHGSGADALFRAEIAYFRGDMPAAEIAAYKAIFLADSKRQDVIKLGAAKVLADIAVLRSDAPGWRRAIDAMACVTPHANQNSYTLRILLDTVQGAILTELRAQTRIADWLKNDDFLSLPLSPSMHYNALYVHVLYLLHQGEVTRFIGTLEALPTEVVTKSAVSESLYWLFLALGYMSIGNKTRTAECLERSAEKALPDGFVLSLAICSFALQGLVEDLFKRKYPSLLDAFNTAKTQYGIGWNTLHAAVFKDELPADLTAREHEIALLAAEGMHNSEIAKILFVTESTVRTHLRTIFQKLDIDRRAKLADKLK